MPNFSIVCSDSIPISKCRGFVESACDSALNYAMQYRLIPDKKCLFFNRDLLFLCLKSGFDYYEQPEKLFVSLIFDFNKGLAEMMCGVMGENGVLYSSKIFLQDNFFAEVSNGIIEIKRAADGGPIDNTAVVESNGKNVA